MRKIVEIFFFDAGGGHRAATEALSDVLGERFPGWRVRAINLQTLLEPIDLVHKITKKIPPRLRQFLNPVAPGIVDGPFRSQEFYNTVISRGQTLGAGALLTLLQHFIDSKTDEIEELLRAQWVSQQEPPDVVVSVIPNFNRFLFNALKDVLPQVPYVTIMTDMLDIPPHFWMEDQDQYLICGTKAAYDQAKETRFFDTNRIYRVSGMILKKGFYRQGLLKHEDIGLRADSPTALIMFGGNGSALAEKIVDQVGSGLQTIVLCGHNTKLLETLSGRPRCCAVGYVENVPDYMRLADVFIGKPGPGSISEALHSGCPVIVESNASTLPQERPNVEWILENGVGVAVKSFKTGLGAALKEVVSNLEIYKRNIKCNIPENRAAYEIAGILGQIAEVPELYSDRQNAPAGASL